MADGAGASQAEPEWRTLVDKEPRNGLHFRGESGHAYRFRITATDRALNSASTVFDPVLIPVDDRDRGILHLSRGWKRTRVNNAWGRTVVRASAGRRDGAHALPGHAGGADRAQARQGRQAAHDDRRQEPDAARTWPHRSPERSLGEPEARSPARTRCDCVRSAGGRWSSTRWRPRHERRARADPRRPGGDGSGRAAGRRARPLRRSSS